MAASPLPAAEAEEVRDIVVDFDYEGDVTASGSIVVEPGCVLRGGAFAPSVRVAGRIEGAVHADRYEVTAEGAVTGDVRVGVAKVAGRQTGLLVAGRALLCEGSRIEGQLVADQVGCELGVELKAVVRSHPGASADAELIASARRSFAPAREQAPPAPAPVRAEAPAPRPAAVPAAAARVEPRVEAVRVAAIAAAAAPFQGRARVEPPALEVPAVPVAVAAPAPARPLVAERPLAERPLAGGPPATAPRRPQASLQPLRATRSGDLPVPSLI